MGLTVERLRGPAHRDMTFDPDNAPFTPDLTALGLSVHGNRERGPDAYAASQALFRRAKALIPGGIHLSGRPLIDHRAQDVAVLIGPC